MGKDQSLTLLGSNGINIQTDAHYEDCVDLEYDLIVLPGGLKNAQLLSDC